MSKEYVNRAYRTHVGNPAAKHVLTVIADHVNDDGSGWVAVSRLVAFTDLSESTVRRSISALVKKGLMTSDTNGGTYRTNLYVLLLPDYRTPVTVTGGEGVKVTGCQTDGVSPGQGDGVTVTGGVVSPGQGDGVTVTPNPSDHPENRPKPAEAPAGGPDGRLEFPQDFPELMKGAMTAWWNFKTKRGQGYQPMGWRALLRLAAKHTLEEVTTVVALAIQKEWNGLYFRQTAKRGPAAGGEAFVREKKEGGRLFGHTASNRPGFRGRRSHFWKKGTRPPCRGMSRRRVSAVICALCGPGSGQTGAPRSKPGRGSKKAAKKETRPHDSDTHQSER